MLQLFLDQSLCIRQATPSGEKLVFPSQFRRDIPEIPEHPHVLVSYAFAGHPVTIYTTLVVRLWYGEYLEKPSLWKDAAEFRTYEGKKLGFVMGARARGQQS